MEIAIIGAGASGMAAAIAASADRTNTVRLFERQARVGKKLLATGNGRCNLSNRGVGPEHYHGADPSFVLPALEAFPVEKTLELFRSLGLLTLTEDSGRIYPYSDQANSVVDVLRFALERSNLRLHTATEITGVRREADSFVLRAGEERFRADRLIIACGGAAGGKLGGGLSGYQLLRSLGHHCTRLYPSLVQLKTNTELVRSLKGVRANAKLQLCLNDCLIAESSGEVQFTEYGVSGPAVFDLSRAASTAGTCDLQLDLLPDLPGDALLSELCIRISRFPNLLCEDLLTGILHNRLGRVVVKSCEISLSTPITELNWKQLNAIVAACHSFVLHVLGTTGMDNAQVTAGGVCTQEFRAETLESKIVPGLYAAGEVLDIDGDCGGYNLQWAWSSGLLAGQLR